MLSIGMVLNCSDLIYRLFYSNEKYLYWYYPKRTFGNSNNTLQ